ncbi:MAG: NADH-quinone oxidoreductase subunit C [Planctomycetota bacterium]|nr:NADH-quinone oxidoreductase subunit C [Planctomycetota bacterium]
MAVDMADTYSPCDALPAPLRSQVIDQIVHQGQLALHCTSADQRPMLEHFKTQQGYDFLVDVTAIDHLGMDRTERFEVVYVLRRTRENSHQFRLHVWLSEDSPNLPTVFDLWDSARWGERETHDMFGIVFDGNPDLRRLLMPEDYPGFPLLKDYPLRGMGERRQFPNVVPRGDQIVEEEPGDYPTSIGRGMHTPEYTEEVRRDSKPR